MKKALWMVGVVGIATMVYGQLEVGVEQVVGLSGAVTNGMVYQLQINDDLNDTNGWEDLYEPVVSDATETNHWYYHPETNDSQNFRMAERPAEAADYVGVFLDPFHAVLSEAGQASLGYFQTEMLANATFLFNPLTEVKGYNVTYQSVDANGSPQDVSGLLVCPTPKGYYGELPMMSIQHPTQIARMGSPSFMCIRDDEFSWIVAYVIASTGYIVVMPDYAGLGVNMDIHPYCHTSISQYSVDFIHAATNMMPHQTSNVTWNGELYLMGFSEGGYATMVTARDIEQNHPALDLRGTACLDGPYSLSDTMHNVILNADTNYQDPYFLPMVINGYDYIYSNDFDFARCIISNTAGIDNYPAELQPLIDGNYSSEEVNAFMFDIAGYEGPRSVLTAPCLADLDNPNSKINLTLASNDAYLAWVPANPLRMFHNFIDDLVPYGNATNAYNGLIAQGADTNIVQLEDYILFIPGMGSIHSGSFPVAMVKGYLWLDSIAYTNR